MPGPNAGFEVTSTPSAATSRTSVPHGAHAGDGEISARLGDRVEHRRRRRGRTLPHARGLADHSVRPTGSQDGLSRPMVSWWDVVSRRRRWSAAPSASFPPSSPPAEHAPRTATLTAAASRRTVRVRVGVIEKSPFVARARAGDGILGDPRAPRRLSIRKVRADPANGSIQALGAAIAMPGTCSDALGKASAPRRRQLHGAGADLGTRY